MSTDSATADEVSIWRAVDQSAPPPSHGSRWVLGVEAMPGALALDLRVEDGAVVGTRPSALFAPATLRRGEPAPVPSAQPDGDSSAATAKFSEVAAALLGTSDDLGVPARFAKAEDATYDFDEYVLLRERDDPMSARAPGTVPADPRFASLRAAAGAGMDWAIETVIVQRLSGSTTYVAIGAALRQTLLGWWSGVAAVRTFNRLARLDPAEVAKLAAPHYPTGVYEYYGACLGEWLVNAATDEIAAALHADPAAAAPLFADQFWIKVRDGVFDRYFEGLRPADPLVGTGPYPFEPVPPDEAFFGLQVVHRQTWRQLGFARGDLVGTVPLGPRETRRVSVTSSRRSKVTRTAEDSSSFETSAESSTMGKDTSEVVTEASKTTNRHAEAEVAGGYPPYVNAKVSGGLSEDVGESSKQTNSNLNEQMQKTASRMQRDTKVTVATEEEVTFQQSASSELTNPNDEVAVTYLYHRLQQRYWVSTSVAEVNNVLFVPEPVPAPEEVDETWLMTHGEVLAGALLDQSYAGVLAAVRGEPSDLAYPETDVFSSSAGSAIKAVSGYSGYSGGGDLPDVLGSGQQYFERDFERRSSLALDQARRQHQLRGLLAHVRRNILHYLRAIWSSEDPDSRMRRYSKLRVPVEWVFVHRDAAASDPRIDVDGYFVPSSRPPMPLDDVIEPTGPVGYLFKCAIWRVRNDVRLVNSHTALAHLRAAYARFVVTVALEDSSELTVRQAVAVAPRRFDVTYPLVWRQSRRKWLIPVKDRDEMDWIEVSTPADGSLDVLGIRVWLDGLPVDGEMVTVKARVTSELEDPHLRLVRVQHPLPPRATEDAFFADALLAEMAPFIDLEARPDAATWLELSEEQRERARSGYHEYVMRRDSGRLVTVDTANTVLDLEVGRTAALEPFKRLHRYIDVMKEYEELRRRQLENDRRQRLLSAGRLGDTDIERVTLVGSVDGLGGHVVLDEKDEEAPA